MKDIDRMKLAEQTYRDMPQLLEQHRGYEGSTWEALSPRGRKPFYYVADVAIAYAGTLRAPEADKGEVVPVAHVNGVDLTDTDLHNFATYAESMRKQRCGPLLTVSVEGGIMIERLITEINRLRPYEVELRRIADDLGEPNDPFAAWEKLAPASPAAAPAAKPFAYVPLSKSHGHEGEPIWRETRRTLDNNPWPDNLMMPLYAAPPAASADAVRARAKELAERIVSTARETDFTCELRFDYSEAVESAIEDLVSALSTPVAAADAAMRDKGGPDA